MFELVVAAPARRTLEQDLPEGVAAAIIEFIVGALIENPMRVGTALRPRLDGIWCARRGAYRVFYVIDQKKGEVQVLRVIHRTHAYRTRNSSLD